jgi:hypothetical protein
MIKCAFAVTRNSVIYESKKVNATKHLELSKIIQSGRGKKYHKIFLDKNLGLHYTISKKSGWSSLKNMAIQEI